MRWLPVTTAYSEYNLFNAVMVPIGTLNPDWDIFTNQNKLEREDHRYWVNTKD